MFFSGDSCFFHCYFKKSTAYELRISDCSSDLCSSDLPSRVAGTQGGAKVALEQRTDYPVGARSTLALSVSRTTRFALRLRVPGWATGGATKIGRASCRGRVCKQVYISWRAV